MHAFCLRPSLFSSFWYSRTPSCKRCRTGLAELMDSEIETFERVREIILWGQVYDRMERTVDAVSDLADTLEEVALKYV